jgi:hypothetical protein
LVRRCGESVDTQRGDIGRGQVQVAPEIVRIEVNQLLTYIELDLVMY